MEMVAVPDEPVFNKMVSNYNAKYQGLPTTPESQAELDKIQNYGWSQLPGKKYNQWAKEMSFDPDKPPALSAQIPTEPPVKAKLAEPEPKELPKPPEHAALPQPKELTPEQKKAAKPTPLSASMFGATYMSIPQAAALDQAVKEFNAKWQGKTLTDPTEINQKIADYQALKAKADAITAEAKAAVLKKQQEELQGLIGTTEEDQQNYKILTNVVSPDYAKIFIQSARSAIKNKGLKISPVEGAIIRAYTASYYKGINAELRDGKMNENNYHFAKALDHALAKLPVHVGTTYRKSDLPANVAKKYVKGDLVFERAFTSSSTSQGTWSGDYRYIIHGTNGRDVKPISEHPSEQEVLYKSNSVFRVLNVDGHTIHLEQVD
jgi:hypothetical protein